MLTENVVDMKESNCLLSNGDWQLLVYLVDVMPGIIICFLFLLNFVYVFKSS